MLLSTTFASKGAVSLKDQYGLPSITIDVSFWEDRESSGADYGMLS